MFSFVVYLFIKTKGHLPSRYGNTDTRFYDNCEKRSAETGCEKKDLLKSPFPANGRPEEYVLTVKKFIFDSLFPGFGR